MKKLTAYLLVCVLALSACVTCALCVNAQSYDAQRASSLTIHYGKGEENFEGLSVKTYRIAELVDDGGYRLCGAFADYSVAVYGISSQTEWKRITSTIASYIAADKISPDLEGTTDVEGNVSFSGIRTGLYLTLAVRHETKELVTLFENFITAVPGRDFEGAYTYDVRVVPKHESFLSTPDETEFKVVKQWKDAGGQNKRPESVEVEIYRDGRAVESVKLSAENDWCYKWTAPDDKSTWTAVERNIPEGYKVTVTSDGKTIVITNSCETHELPPDTGDTELLSHYVLAACLSGLALITLGVIRMRLEK